jgi:hypothetical protein
MGRESTNRSSDAAERRYQREAQRRQRELERKAKEQAKLTAIEQARLEVETYQNHLDVLLSVHKEQGRNWDWMAISTSLPPPPPQRHSYHEFAVRLQDSLLAREPMQSEFAIAQARSQDEQDHTQELHTQLQALANLENLRALARRIRAGDLKAYTKALADLSPLGEISTLGSTIYFAAHNSQLLEANLKVKGARAIPAEVKTLTATERLSVKPMPKARFHELYQDYICACVLRVAREVFALLPIRTLLITASAESSDTTTGRLREQPVLSVAIDRDSLAHTDFDNYDASDIIERFTHRGEFKTSRNTGLFARITPLTPEDISSSDSESVQDSDLLGEVRRLREQVRAELALLTPKSEPNQFETTNALWPSSS